MSIGEVVRYHRGQADMSQEELAQKAGLSPTGIVRLEGGQIKRPRAKTLARLADALGVDQGALLEAVAAPLAAASPSAT